MTEGATHESPRWSPSAKALAALLISITAAALIIRFQGIIPLMLVAGILAYVMLPFVRALTRRAHLPWPVATTVSFLILFLALITGITAAGLAIIQQLQALFVVVQQFLSQIVGQLDTAGQQTFLLGPWQVDLSQLSLPRLAEQLVASVQPAVAQAGSVVTSLATVAVESVAGLLFVLTAAYFLTLDYRRLVSGWRTFTIPGYKTDLGRLKLALARIWNAFLRGQLLIVLITGVLSCILMSILGLQSALALGVLAGIAKFVPILGPTTAGAVAALLAFFQPMHVFELSPLGHAALVVISVFVLDQLIDYLLIPRILGTSLNLHPIVILLGAIVGASLAGIIGLLLAAPSMATLILLGRYTYRKMVDLSPWDPPIDALPPPHPTGRALLEWGKRLRNQRKAEKKRESTP